tara:strand:+ start:535 stop:3102 length:2568 start_codon:yes stop_codon:yes gene_type:complete
MAIKKNKRYMSSVGNIGVAQASNQNYVSEALTSASGSVARVAGAVMNLEEAKLKAANAEIDEQDRQTENTLENMYIAMQGDLDRGNLIGAKNHFNNMTNLDSTKVSNWTNKGSEALTTGTLAHNSEMLIANANVINNQNIVDFQNKISSEEFLLLSPDDQVKVIGTMKESHLDNLRKAFSINENGEYIGDAIPDKFKQIQLDAFGKLERSYNTNIHAKDGAVIEQSIKTRKIKDGETKVDVVLSALNLELIKGDGFVDDSVFVDQIETLSLAKTVSDTTTADFLIENNLFTNSMNTILERRNDVITQEFRNQPAEIYSAILDWVTTDSMQGDFTYVSDGITYTIKGNNSLVKETGLNNHPEITAALESIRKNLETKLKKTQTDRANLELVENLSKIDGPPTVYNTSKKTQNEIQELSDQHIATVTNTDFFDPDQVGEETAAMYLELLGDSTDPNLKDMIQAKARWTQIYKSEGSIFNQLLSGMPLSDANKDNFLEWFKGDKNNAFAALDDIYDEYKLWLVNGDKENGSKWFARMSDTLLPYMKRYENLFNRSGMTDDEVYNAVFNDPFENRDLSVPITVHDGVKKISEIDWRDVISDSRGELKNWKKLINKSTVFWETQIEVAGEFVTPAIMGAHPVWSEYPEPELQWVKKFFDSETLDKTFNRFLTTNNKAKGFLTRTIQDYIVKGLDFDDSVKATMQDFKRIYTLDPIMEGGIVEKNFSLLNNFDLNKDGLQVKQWLTENSNLREEDINEMVFGKDLRFALVGPDYDPERKDGEPLELGTVYWLTFENSNGTRDYIRSKDDVPLAMWFSRTEVDWEKKEEVDWDVQKEKMKQAQETHKMLLYPSLFVQATRGL